MKPLTPTQRTILENASERSNGNIEPLPNNINTGIRQRVIDSLLNRQLIDSINNDYIINDAGWAAIDRVKPPNPETAKITTKKPREGSKLAIIVALLKREDGITLDELCEATSWKKHTLRGTFSGTLKKRFGYTVTSTKEEGKQRRYLITNNEK